MPPPPWKPPKPPRSMKSAAGPVAPVERALQHDRVEGEVVALEHRRGDGDDGVGDVRAGEHRDGGVRRVDVGLVLALVPFLDELRRLDVAGGAHRPVGEDDRARRHAGQRQLAVGERRAARVQHEERRHRAGLGDLPMAFCNGCALSCASAGSPSGTQRAATRASCRVLRPVIASSVRLKSGFGRPWRPPDAVISGHDTLRASR